LIWLKRAELFRGENRSLSSRAAIAPSVWLAKPE
jgi:hypothetical protein